MKIFIQNFCFIFFLLLSGGKVAYAADSSICVMDDHGRIIRMSQPAQRIISLAPHITETLYAIGAGVQIVGTVSASDYPPAARRIPRVGTYLSVDVETILALKPDLIIVWGASPLKQLLQLQKKRIPIFVTDPRTADDIAGAMVQFGRLTGHEKAAERKAASFRQRFIRLKETYQEKPMIRVFLQVWQRPIITVGGGSFLNHAIQTCRGVNIFNDSPLASLTVGADAVLIRRPDILVATMSIDQEGYWRQGWRRYQSLEAIQKGKLFILDVDSLSRPGPSFLEGNEKLCQIIDRGR